MLPARPINAERDGVPVSRYNGMARYKSRERIAYSCASAATTDLLDTESIEMGNQQCSFQSVDNALRANSEFNRPTDVTP